MACAFFPTLAAGAIALVITSNSLGGGSAMCLEEGRGTNTTSDASFDRVSLMPPTWIQALTGTMEFTADLIEYEETEITQVRFPVTFERETIKITEATVSTRSGKLGISGMYTFSNKDLAIRVSSDSLSFSDSETIASPSERLFDKVGLVTEWLNSAGGRVTVDLGFDVVVFDDLVLQNVNGPVVLHDQGVEVALGGELGGGAVVLDIDHDYASEGTTVKVRGTGISLGVIAATQEYIDGASANFNVDLAGVGSTERSFVSSATGFVDAEIGAGRINNLELDRLTQNILSMTLGSLLPFENTIPQAQLECAALRFDFDDGLAAMDHGIFIRTNQLILIGSGGVNLNTEQLDLHFEPYVRQQVKLKPAGTARMLSVTGSLNDPKLSATAGGLLNEGLSLGTSWATIGLSKAAEAALDRGSQLDINCRAAVRK